MLIALPNFRWKFYLYLVHVEERIFDLPKERKDVVTFFETNFPDSIDVIPELVKIKILLVLGNHEMFSWTYGDKVALIVMPVMLFCGQGMNVGFEDISILKEMMEKYRTETSEYENAESQMQMPLRARTGIF
jgi:kynurenine 3-monooxygenase